VKNGGPGEVSTPLFFWRFLFWQAKNSSWSNNPLLHRPCVLYMLENIIFLLRHTSFPYFFLLLLLLFFRSSKKEKGSDYIGILKIQSPPGLMCIALLLSSTASRFPILSFIHSFLFYFLFFTFLFSIFNFFFFFSLLLESVLRHAITNKTYTTRPCEDPSMKRD
jgi:hypothetical protein